MNPERALAAIAELATHLAVEWPAYRTVEANLANPVMAAAGQGTGRGSEIPDPVHSVAWSHVRYHSTCDDLEEALEALRRAQRCVSAVRHHHSDIAAEYDRETVRARCSGEIDPTCVRNAVRDGLCWSCYQARRAHGAAEAKRRKQG